jgi:hypothetical protein
MCFYSPDYKFTVERITLNKNNKFLNHHYSVLMDLATTIVMVSVQPAYTETVT